MNNNNIQRRGNSVNTFTTVLSSELFSGILHFKSIWHTLGWLDIKQRYRRSVIGPFWLTISTLIMVAALGLVYSVLFNQPLQAYLPYLAVGLIIWTLISTLILESCDVFIAAESMIKQVKLPFTVHVMRMVWRNLIILLHNVVVLVAVVLFFVKSWNLSLMTVPLAILVIAANGLFLGLILGVFCTRFRDIAPIVVNVTQLTFFITPIFWNAEALTERAWVVKYNPIYHFIEIARLPILSGTVPLISWLVVSVITLVLAILAVVVMRHYHHRIAYWV